MTKGWIAPPTVPCFIPWLALRAPGQTPGAVVNSFNELMPGHIHLNALCQAIKLGIAEAGGTRLNFRPSPSATAWPPATRA